MNLEPRTPQQELQRAAEAKRLLDDPLFKEARANLDADLATLRRDVPIGSAEMHTKLIMLEQIKDKFFSFFELTAQTGKLAQLYNDDLEQRRRTLGERLKTYATYGRNGI